MDSSSRGWRVAQHRRRRHDAISADHGSQGHDAGRTRGLRATPRRAALSRPADCPLALSAGGDLVRRNDGPAGRPAYAPRRRCRLHVAFHGDGAGRRRRRHHEISPPAGLLRQTRARAAERLQLTLADSLHAPTDDLRSQLVPVNRKWPVAELLDASGEYVRQTGRRISFEYVLMEGVNDTPELAAILGELLRARAGGMVADDAPPAGIPVGESHGELPQGGGSGYAFHVNLIPWNPVYGLQYQRPDRERVAAFVQGLRARGIPTTVRMERGVDIDAACGQLQRTHGATAPGNPNPGLAGSGRSAETRERGSATGKGTANTIAKHSG